MGHHSSRSQQQHPNHNNESNNGKIQKLKFISDSSRRDDEHNNVAPIFCSKSRESLLPSSSRDEYSTQASIRGIMMDLLKQQSTVTTQSSTTHSAAAVAELEKFFIAFHQKHHKQHTTDPSVYDTAIQHRVVFVSVIGLYASFRRIPTHILFSAIFIVKIKREWLYHPTLHANDPNNVLHKLLYDSDEEFMRMLQWKDSQGLLVCMYHDNNNNDSDDHATPHSPPQEKEQQEEEEACESSLASVPSDPHNIDCDLLPNDFGISDDTDEEEEEEEKGKEGEEDERVRHVELTAAGSLPMASPTHSHSHSQSQSVHDAADTFEDQITDHNANVFGLRLRLERSEPRLVNESDYDGPRHPRLSDNTSFDVRGQPAQCLPEHEHHDETNAHCFRVAQNETKLTLSALDDELATQTTTKCRVHPLWTQLSMHMSLIYDPFDGRNYGPLILDDTWWLQHFNTSQYGTTAADIVHELTHCDMGYRCIMEMLFQSNPSLIPCKTFRDLENVSSALHCKARPHKVTLPEINFMSHTRSMTAIDSLSECTASAEQEFSNNMDFDDSVWFHNEYDSHHMHLHHSSAPKMASQFSQLV
eukprot:CAMPEP_0202708464 /NCGR_PEP_ID=MMETSP1385-20130828/20666_1 /ASSEMBLY_ACC=CAM_ASM_000861 /TAXON_ID=933848 /ORGANISM="Elphidium margaritaceum" /LENGTH=585 /DNA_ID=CAMNT_0049367439 /DNA_START=121 /DNA_END=1878 /DNA_ORIENTATION=+